MIGDGHINRTGAFRFAQSITHKEYFDCINYIFHNLISSSELTRHFNNQLSRNYWSYSFTTFKLDCFKSAREIWYPNEKKIIPKDFKLSLTNLAYTIMDDGSHQSGGIFICLFNFGQRELENYCEQLNKLTRLSGHYSKVRKVIHDNKEYSGIYIQKVLVEELCKEKTFTRHFNNKMEYKIKGGIAHVYNPTKEMEDECLNLVKHCRNHEHIYNLPPITCPNCHRVCKTPVENYWHLVMKYCKSDIKKCPICDKVVNQLKSHYERHFF